MWLSLFRAEKGQTTMTTSTQAGIARQVAQLRERVREMRQDRDDLVAVEIGAARHGWNDRRVGEIETNIARIDAQDGSIALRIGWLEGLAAA